MNEGESEGRQEEESGRIEERDRGKEGDGKGISISCRLPTHFGKCWCLNDVYSVSHLLVYAV